MEYGLGDQSLIHNNCTGVLLFITSEIAPGFPQPPELQILMGHFPLGIRDNQNVMLTIHPKHVSKMRKHGPILFQGKMTEQRYRKGF